MFTTMETIKRVNMCYQVRGECWKPPSKFFASNSKKKKDNPTKFMSLPETMQGFPQNDRGSN